MPPVQRPVVNPSLTLLALLVACRGDKGGPMDTGPFDHDEDGWLDQDDCGPEDASVYPGADEVCGDGVVNDCDGAQADAEEACRIDGDYNVSNASAVLVGTQKTELVGIDLSALGDQDGDGASELLVTASGLRYSNPDAPDAFLHGSTFIVSGDVTGTVPLLLENVVAIVSPWDTDDLYLTVSVGPGDLDGDGYPDLATGAWLYDKGCSEQPGTAFVFDGPFSGEVTAPADAVGVWRGETENACAGARMARVGDTDGDGLPDLLVGAPCDSNPLGGVGQAYVVLGPATGSATLDQAAAKIVSGDIYALGAVSAGAGDVDGDGFQDILLGDPYYPIDSTNFTGRALVFLGPVSGVVDTMGADAMFFGTRTNDWAGVGLDGAGDQNGDGYDDLVIGAPGYTGYRSNQAYVINGPPPASLDLADADASINPSTSEEKHAGLGFTVAGLEDLDADGLDDVGVTISYIATVDPYDVYRVALFLSPLEGEILTSDAWSMLSRDPVFDRLGDQLVAMGDTNGDGRADIAVSDRTFAPESDSSESTLVDAGAVFLLRPWGY